MTNKCFEMANYRTNQKSLITCSNTKRKRLWCPSLVVVASFISTLLIIPSAYGNGCPVLQTQRCDFKYTWSDPSGIKPDVAVTSCREDIDFDGSGEAQNVEYDDNNEKIYYCPLNADFDGEKTWGECNGHCFDEDNNEPTDFGGDNSAAGMFCKIKSQPCVFPFKYNGKDYTSCIQRGKVSWCPTSVDQNSNAITGFWGQCDVDVGKTDCDPNWTSPPKPEKQTDFEPMVAIVEINKEDFTSNVSASLKFEQNGPDDVLKITGTVHGLSPGAHGFHIHEDPFTNGDCTTAGAHFNPSEMAHGRPGATLGSHIGDLGNIVADGEGTAKVNIPLDHKPRPTLYSGKESILGLTLVIHEDEDDLSADGDGLGNAGARLACGILKEDRKVEEGIGILWLIIILVVVILLVLAILTCIICYCKRGKNPQKERLPQTNGVQDPVDSNGYKCKRPLYDELSIPFIDASPAPSPKPGRSTDRLSFFNRSTSAIGSRGSLSIPPPYAPPPPPFASSTTSINRLIGSLKVKAGFDKKTPKPVEV